MDIGQRYQCAIKQILAEECIRGQIEITQPSEDRQISEQQQRDPDSNERSEWCALAASGGPSHEP